MSNSLYPDLYQQNARSGLEPNCLQRISTDDTSRQEVNVVLFS